ncbi:ABC transporter substrate-binding protein [Thalassolituus sp. C2-1]|uniref:substrate-binding periplasmic protein n=1 Tax=Venatorbacter sp. C2-1 TaxID=2597518 RepID=UPI00118EC057|nr:transporter substrate-binding domain-containing protein [Thalassolituus sp. C2-1]TVV43190.1 amino acid ABC transporter substrate-binding protein [Thalassolituus sp. C2-1]
MRHILCAVLLLIGGIFPAQAENKFVYLTSLSWPPYSDPQMAEQGASVAVAKAAFSAMGYTLVVEFYPWSRAVHLAKDESSKYAGYFPEYYSEDIAAEFIFSDSMGSGPLGFVQPAGKPVAWSSLDDLKKYQVGVVKDYVNTADFDAMVAAGQLKVSEVISDKSNIQKAAFSRIDLAVIDKNVLEYSVKTDPDLIKLKDKISFNDKLLEDKKLFICFKKNQQAIADIFNEGLKKIDAAKIQADYLAGLK